VWRPPAIPTNVRKEHFFGDLIDVNTVGEAEWHTINLGDQHLRFATTWTDTHQPLISVRDVKVAGPVVEAQAQRAATLAVRHFRRRSAGFGVVAQAVRVGRPTAR
jgi:hypothetical protein